MKKIGCLALLILMIISATISISDYPKLYGSSITSNSANKVTEGSGKDLNYRRHRAAFSLFSSVTAGTRLLVHKGAQD